MKKQLKAKVALLMLVAATALTGCGKSKNNTVGGIGAGPAPVAPTYPGGFNGSTLVVGGNIAISNASGTTYRSGFNGGYANVNTDGAWLTSASGAGGGYTFGRSSYYGNVTLSVANMPTIGSNNSFTQTSATAVVNLTTEAVTLFQQPHCGAPAIVYLGFVQLASGHITTSIQVGDANGRCSLRI